MTVLLALRNVPSDTDSPADQVPLAGLVGAADPFVAAARGEIRALTDLLRGGGSPNLIRAGVSLLETAAGAGQERAVRALLRAGALPGAALHAAAAGGDPAVVTALLDHGVPVDLRDACGFTPLLTAVAADREAAALVLLRRGADARAEVGDTGALALARRVGNARLLGVLRQRGARG